MESSNAAAPSATVASAAFSSASDHSGFLIQGRFGERGNFEVIVPHSASGLLHFWRSNDKSDSEWVFQRHFARGDRLQHYRALSFIHSNFGNNFDLVAVLGNTLLHTYRDSEYQWRRFVDVGLGVSGSPALIQSRFGQRGNFEVVAPSTGNGLRHFYRDNDALSRRWSEADSFAADEGHFSAAALIQSNYGVQLEVVATVGTRLLHYRRDASRVWHGPAVVAEGVCGTPGFIQSRRGTRGNFEVVVPSCDGGLCHFYRDNDATTPMWHHADHFAACHGVFDAASLIESSFGARMELVAVAGNLLFHIREHGEGEWLEPTLFGRLDRDEESSATL